MKMTNRMADKKRKMKSTLKKQGEQRAINNSCPECGRKNALTTIKVDDIFRVRKCRWCKYEEGISI
jgi:hypothetical protein